MITDLHNNSLTDKQNPLFIFYHISVNKLQNIGKNIYRLLNTPQNYYQFGDIYTTKKNCKILLAKCDDINTKFADSFNKTVINSTKVLKPSSQDKTFINLGHVKNDGLKCLLVNKKILPEIGSQDSSLLFNVLKVKYSNSSHIYHSGRFTNLIESPKPWYGNEQVTKTKTDKTTVKYIICCLCLLLLILILVNRKKLSMI